MKRAILKILPIIFSPDNRVCYGVGDSLGHVFAGEKEIWWVRRKPLNPCERR